MQNWMRWKDKWAWIKLLHFDRVWVASKQFYPNRQWTRTTWRWLASSWCVCKLLRSWNLMPKVNLWSASLLLWSCSRQKKSSCSKVSVCLRESPQIDLHDMAQDIEKSLKDTARDFQCFFSKLDSCKDSDPLKTDWPKPGKLVEISIVITATWHQTSHQGEAVPAIALGHTDMMISKLLFFPPQTDSTSNHFRAFWCENKQIRPSKISYISFKSLEKMTSEVYPACFSKKTSCFHSIISPQIDSRQPYMRQLRSVIFDWFKADIDFRGLIFFFLFHIIMLWNDLRYSIMLSTVNLRWNCWVETGGFLLIADWNQGEYNSVLLFSSDFKADIRVLEGWLLFFYFTSECSEMIWRILWVIYCLNY